MGRDELAAWPQLLEAPGVGQLSARRLLAAWGSPQAVLAASVSSRAGVVPRKVAEATDQPNAELPGLIERTRAWLAGDDRRQLLRLRDAAYPAAWLALADPPLLVYAIGLLELLQRPAVAIVGTRHPTPEGVSHAHDFAAALS